MKIKINKTLAVPYMKSVIVVVELLVQVLALYALLKVIAFATAMAANKSFEETVINPIELTAKNTTHVLEQ